MPETTRTMVLAARKNRWHWVPYSGAVTVLTKKKLKLPARKWRRRTMKLKKKKKKNRLRKAIAMTKLDRNLAKNRLWQPWKRMQRRTRPSLRTAR